MYLTTTCPNCKEQTRVKSTATDRRDLIRDKGETFNLQCNSCKENFNVHVNDVRAKSSHFIIISGMVIGILLTIVLWVFYGAIGAITLTIPLVVLAQQEKSVRDFNVFMTQR